MNRRIGSLLLSAAMLLTPGASLAEAAAAPSYTAGELTTTVIGDSYSGGNQINLDAALGVVLEDDAAQTVRAAAELLGLNPDEAKVEKVIQAAARLLDQSALHMSFYDDFGTARLHAEWETDGVTLLTADALLYEDGSAQLMSSLTGKLVLAIPAREQSESVSLADYNLDDPAQLEAFRALPAVQRLQITGSDMISLFINHLLGWVSYMQMDNDGEFYVFDDTYLEATESRDPVAQRMLGTIKADSFTTLLWNVATTVADTTGEFQQALADFLAERGVTRYQARMFTDSLLTEETIDPATDFVQTSYYIVENKDESPIQYDDVSYFFKKLQKSVQRIWDNSTANIMEMDVSYDDFGGMVGFDAHAPQFTTLLPYEGDFTYSIKTDDNWQRFHTAHGELQVYNENRVIGDLDMQLGEDVEGLKHSSLEGKLDVLDQKADTSRGIGVHSNLDFKVEAGENGQESETFEAGLLLNARENGEETPAVGMTLSGMTTAETDRFDMNATAALMVDQAGELVVDMTLAQAEYEEIPFAGGQAIDVKTMDDAAKETIKSEIKAQAAKLGVKLVTKPGVLADLLTVFGQML